MDKRAEILRLASQGHGDRHIIKVLDVTRYQVAQTLREAKAKKDAATGIPVDLIDANPKARPLVAGHVAALMQSIPTIGLLVPISVRAKAERYELIAGGHRTQAFRELGRDTIPALIIDVDDLTAELMLIDENLIRQDLSPAERSIALRRRKAIYEELHPETKHGGDRKSDHIKSSGEIRHLIKDKPIEDPPKSVSRETPASTSVAVAPRVERFTAVTAKATGISERSIREAVTRANAIGDSSLKKIVGTSLDKGEELDALAKVSPQRRDELIARAASGEKVTAKPVVKQEIRAAREAELGSKITAGNLALPDRKFGVILCDWPRRPTVWSDETGMDRAPDNHYATQTFRWAVDELAPAIARLAAPDAMLVFWSTAASLIDDIEIMTEAGFCALRRRDGFGRLLRDSWGEPFAPLSPGGGTYRSHQIWDKELRGTGRWFIDRHELVLIGVRGKIPCPAPGTQSLSIFAERRGEPSAKPEFVAAEIDRLWPNLPKIELFRRGAPRAGWAAWGAEATHTPSPGLYGDSPVLATVGEGR